MQDKIIGIVGGIGPYAGLDLNMKIFDQTMAKSDQEHLKVILISSPDDISDRTEYLMGKADVNPAHAIYKIIQKLELIGADVVGIPCNTVYAPEIFNVLTNSLYGNGNNVEIVHMIEEVSSFTIAHYPDVKNIGILGTNGTFHTGIYTKILEQDGFKVIYPDMEIQYSFVHSAIYDPLYGIKSQSNPVTFAAKEKIYEAAKHLINKGCDGIVLACTEVPLAVKENKIANKPVLDATLILARALIRRAAPEKLKNYTTEDIFILDSKH